MSRSTLVSIAQITLYRLLVRLRLDERVDDRAAEEAPEGGKHQTDEDEARPGRAQQQPAPPLREVDRERVEGDDRDQQKRAQRLEGLHRRLGGAELVRLHDHELAGVRIGVCLQLVLQPEPCRQPLDRRSQVQRDLSVRGRDVAVLAAAPCPPAPAEQPRGRACWRSPRAPAPSVAAAACRRPWVRRCSGAPPPARRQFPFSVPAAARAAGLPRRLAGTVRR